MLSFVHATILFRISMLPLISINIHLMNPEMKNINKITTLFTLFKQTKLSNCVVYVILFIWVSTGCITFSTVVFVLNAKYVFRSINGRISFFKLTYVFDFFFTASRDCTLKYMVLISTRYPLWFPR